MVLAIIIIIVTIIDTDMVAILNSYVISKIFFVGCTGGQMQTTFHRGYESRSKFLKSGLFFLDISLLVD